MDYVGYVHGVAVGLTADVQQYRGLTVRGDHRVHRLNAWAHGGDVADMHRYARRGGLDDDLRELFWIDDLPVHQAEIELMILLQQAGRIDEIRAPHRVENVGNRTPAASSFAGSGVIWNSGSCPPCTTTVATPFSRLSRGFNS